MATWATLIILGVSVRAAAESAVRAGAQPHGIDLFADVDTRAAGSTRQIERYPAEFLRALSEAPQAPWMYTGSLENYPRLVARLAKLRPLLGNGPETLRLVRDPQWLAPTLAGTGVQFPETHPAGEFQPADDGWLLKRGRSGGGMAIRWKHEVAALPRFRNRFWQRFVAGIPFSASYLAAGDRVELIGAAGQWLGHEFGAPEPFQYAGSLAPFPLSAAEVESLQTAGKKLARASGLRGLFGIDLVRSRSGLWLIELNPRYTASMELHEAVQGRSLVAEHCAGFGWGFDPARDKHESAAIVRPHGKGLSNGPMHRTNQDVTIGKVIVYANTPGMLGDPYQSVIRAIQTDSKVTIADISPMGTQFSRGDPICSVLTRGESMEAVEARLRLAADRIRRSLDPLRAPS